MKNDRMFIKMFYPEPDQFLIGSDVNEGDRIGIAQNIATKYGGGMIPHIHLQVDKVDPELLMEE
jgi:hypothetical protein